MGIENIKNGRCILSHVGDVKANKNVPKGFYKHWKITGKILSLSGKAFNDKDSGKWVNTTSVIHYLKRNGSQLNLPDNELSEINLLTDKSSVKDVIRLFNRVKSTKISDESIPERKIESPLQLMPMQKDILLNSSLLPAQMGHKGMRYDRANHVNAATIATLMDSKVAYPANQIKLFNGGWRFIVAESPKGSENEDWNDSQVYPKDDNKFYYEMVWNYSPGILASAADVYDTKGNLDKERFNFLGETETGQFVMTNGDALRVTCTSIENSGPFEVRNLELEGSNGEMRTIQQYIIKGAFRYEDGVGLRAARTLYQTYKSMNRENGVPFIVNCNTGKDRSAALIMWIELFHMLDTDRLKVADISSEFLDQLAATFENQAVPGALTDHIKNTLPRHYKTDQELQDAIHEILLESV